MELNKWREYLKRGQSAFNDRLENSFVFTKLALIIGALATLAFYWSLLGGAARLFLVPLKKNS